MTARRPVVLVGGKLRQLPDGDTLAGDGEAAGGGQQIGDILITARPAVPGYLPADGSLYLQSAYPELFGVVGLLRTGASGVEWSASAPFAISTINAIGTDRDGTWIACGTNNLARSVDGGATWGAASNLGIGTISRLRTDGAGVWIAVSYNKIARSTDNGASWTTITISSSYTATVLETDRNGVWIVAFGEYQDLMRSTDNGLTWTTLTTAPPQQYIEFLATDENGFWLALQMSSQAYLYSVDSGATWTRISRGANAVSADFRGLATDTQGGVDRPAC
ncbi:hypothetical protein EQ832_01520 [Pseudomonas sp. ALS1131]|nr:hypothetical protein [Pseudomonas sp. ALS1131]TRO41721.1 hypothetical protein EQ832_01520 [Pseudomonas sp. ALS1131]